MPEAIRIFIAPPVRGDPAHSTDRPRHRRPGADRSAPGGRQGRARRRPTSSRTSSTTTVSTTPPDELEQIVRAAPSYSASVVPRVAGRSRVVAAARRAPRAYGRARAASAARPRRAGPAGIAVLRCGYSRRSRPRDCSAASVALAVRDGDQEVEPRPLPAAELCSKRRSCLAGRRKRTVRPFASVTTLPRVAGPAQLAVVVAVERQARDQGGLAHREPHAAGAPQRPQADALAARAEAHGSAAARRSVPNRLGRRVRARAARGSRATGRRRGRTRVSPAGIGAGRS